MFNITKKIIKKILPKFVWDFLKQFVHSSVFFFSRFKDQKNNTVLIHIGKCGGSTLKKAIMQVNNDFPFDIVHIEKPFFKSKNKYIIIARGPISRVISAFNWRYKLVVESKSQKNRFRGEYDVLSKYKNLNSISEKLYNSDGKPNPDVHNEMKKIHHIKENIAFYLKDFLKKCPPENISAVLMQENLNYDLKRVFNIDAVAKVKDNSAHKKDISLSEFAKKNLKLFLSDDYEALKKLYIYGKIDKDIFSKIINQN
tara:strand:+ start:49 stop:813 length:765 start_codon:yes stop_codon:yes gene_type:complete